MTNEELQQTIDTYNNYLDRLITSIQHLCEDMENNNFSELSPVVPALVEGFGWVNEAVDSFVKLDKISNDTYRNFQSIIKNLNEAMENKDYMLFHDLLEFEMLPLLGEMKIMAEDLN